MNVSSRMVPPGLLLLLPAFLVEDMHWTEARPSQMVPTLLFTPAFMTQAAVHAYLPCFAAVRARHAGLPQPQALADGGADTAAEPGAAPSPRPWRTCCQLKRYRRSQARRMARGARGRRWEQGAGAGAGATWCKRILEGRPWGTHGASWSSRGRSLRCRGANSLLSRPGAGRAGAGIWFWPHAHAPRRPWSNRGRCSNGCKPPGFDRVTSGSSTTYSHQPLLMLPSKCSWC